MHLVVGLGNPENKYLKTRHNFGFLVLDNLAAKFGESFKAGKGSYYFLKTRYQNNDIILVKPTTYMNRSGEAVAAVCNYFKVDLKDILIICDDLDLELGRIRFRAKGGSGGNNGLESIIMHLGTENFSRLRLGIDSEKRKYDDISFVLSEFPKKEWKLAEFVIVHARDAVLYWIENGIGKTMNEFNSLIIES